MNPMKRAIRKAGAACLFMGIVAGLLAPGFAFAHAEITEREAAGSTTHPPEAPNFQISGITHNAVVIAWSEVHSHPRDRTTSAQEIELREYWISLSTSPLLQVRNANGRAFAGSDRCIYRYHSGTHAILPYLEGIPPEGCIRRNVSPGRSSYSVTVSGLTPETTYYLNVISVGVYHDPVVEETRGLFYYSLSDDSGVSARVVNFRTTATPPEPETPDPETPTEPETPEPETPTPPTTPEPETPTTPEPETPDPSTPDCTYEHRLIGVPGTTGAGYTSQILISSKDSKATVKLRAYQAFNGAPIDVLNSDDQAVGSTTSLSPANSVKMFRLEGARGWHIVIIEHPSKAAMDNATVAMRLREPDTGVSIELAERIEQCTNTATTAE